MVVMRSNGPMKLAIEAADMRRHVGSKCACQVQFNLLSFCAFLCSLLKIRAVRKCLTSR